ncbi:RES domain superfamily [Rheinheimera sp. KL1]|uniref:RES family NAD+ phosphorylase n=1 Tax=Rheinheimera sp. KL1 TaxID=1635005 RepID=UPI0006A9B24D|nr:RES family NAD+ phosphorylase [Rheinheimera sp. KL1]KOO57820.1 RES domain superfamily [Rheinheimera sp. KL1]
MKLYRLTQKKFAEAPFSPAGAKLYGGRWNSKGTEALYFAGSESLCVLEVFVHLTRDPAVIQLYDLYAIDMPEQLIAKLEQEDLPANWRTIPANESTQLIGDEFLNQQDPDYAALQVPSSISPRDHNYIVNPKHQALSEILAAAEKLEFEFDPRIFR